MRRLSQDAAKGIRHLANQKPSGSRVPNTLAEQISDGYQSTDFEKALAAGSMAVGGTAALHCGASDTAEYQEHEKSRHALDQAVESAQELAETEVTGKLQQAHQDNPALTLKESKQLVRDFIKEKQDLFPSMVRDQLANMASKHSAPTQHLGMYALELTPFQAVMRYLYKDDTAMFNAEMSSRSSKRFQELEEGLLEEEITLYASSSSEAASQKADWKLHVANRRNTNTELDPSQFPLGRRASGPPVSRQPRASETTVGPEYDLSANAPAATSAPQATQTNEASAPAATSAPQATQTNEASAPAATAVPQASHASEASAPAATAVPQASHASEASAPAATPEPPSGASSVLETNIFPIEHILYLIALCSQKITLSAIAVWVCVKAAFVFKMYVFIALMACIAHEMWPDCVQTNWRECTVLYRRMRIGLSLLSILPWLL